MSRYFGAIADFDDDMLGRIVSSAQRHPPALRNSLAGRSVALLFLQSSLRTRTGFAVATHRLGGQSVDISAPRYDTSMSSAESVSDTLRVAAGMADIVVCRTGERLAGADAARASGAPILNAGDALEHPTQAIIDYAFMTRAGRRIQDLRLALCGDLQSRVARSMLSLFRRFPPRALRLVAPPTRTPDRAIVPAGAELSDRPNFEGVDVISMMGLPPTRGADTLDAATRCAYALSAAQLPTISADAIILSPMPIIDEIHSDVRGDPRCQMLQQSDFGVGVRMAILEEAAAFMRAYA